MIGSHGNKTMELSHKHKAFINAYLKDPARNASKAYKKIYPRVNNETARRNASRLLTNAHISAFIESIEKKTTEKVELDLVWVKEKLKRFSNAKVTDYFEIKGKKLILKNLNNLPAEIIDCIQEVRQTKDGVVIKLVDKKSSVTDIGRTIGAFSDNLNISGFTLAQAIKKRKEELSGTDS